MVIGESVRLRILVTIKPSPHAADPASTINADVDIADAGLQDDQRTDKSREYGDPATQTHPLGQDHHGEEGREQGGRKTHRSDDIEWGKAQRDEKRVHRRDMEDAAKGVKIEPLGFELPGACAAQKPGHEGDQSDEISEKRHFEGMDFGCYVADAGLHH